MSNGTRAKAADRSFSACGVAWCVWLSDGTSDLSVSVTRSGLPNPNRERRGCDVAVAGCEKRRGGCESAPGSVVAVELAVALCCSAQEARVGRLVAASVCRPQCADRAWWNRDDSASVVPLPHRCVADRSMLVGGEISGQGRRRALLPQSAMPQRVSTPARRSTQIANIAAAGLKSLPRCVVLWSVHRRSRRAALPI